MKAMDAVLEIEREGGENKVEAIQSLINSGLAWRMEGSIGRLCMDFIRAGLCALGKKRHTDAYGSSVPSRYDVQAGTIGSVEFVQEHGNEVMEDGNDEEK